MATYDQAYIDSLEATLESKIISNQYGIDTAWVANCTFLIFLMQTGFTLLKSGTTRYKNYVSCIIKNVLDICTSTLSWWLWGYAFAFGQDKGGFIGSTFFAGDKLETHTDYNRWMFQFKILIYFCLCYIVFMDLKQG